MAVPLYILDTGILVHYVRGDKVWNRIREEYQLFLVEPRPILSIVTSGELRSLALQFEWGKAKLNQMQFALGYFDVMPVESEDLVDAYARIDDQLLRNGTKMGKNDLWIAATAVIYDARVLTVDRDFDPLYPLFLHRDFIDSKF